MKKSQTPKTLMVSAIQHGTVIDHIPPGKATDIVRLLKIPRNGHRVTVGMNLDSRAMGKKDLVKIEGLFLSPEEASQVALVAPDATVNIIKNFSLAKKFTVTLPETVERMLFCPNPTCITNHERMATAFTVRKFKKEILLTCRYCEKTFPYAHTPRAH
jgi:aspartate carbamoyltransferase regulatory subunit